MKKSLRFILSLLLVPFAAHAEYSNSHTVDKLNELLKGEISAVETYDQALEKVKGLPEGEKIAKIRDDHKDAVVVLQKEVQAKGGVPATGSGAWGAWAKTVQGTAKLIGDKAALSALREGEKHGLDEYQELVADQEVEASQKAFAANRIKDQQSHIDVLDSFLNKP